MSNSSSSSSNNNGGGAVTGSVYQHVAGNQTAEEVTLRRAVGALQSGVTYQVEWALKLLLVKSYGEDVFFSEVHTNRKLTRSLKKKVHSDVCLTGIFVGAWAFI